jgi:DNA-binding transcriptional ArsR family regulator
MVVHLKNLTANIDEASDLLAVMSNLKRLEILSILHDESEISVSALNARVDLSQSALSQHLSLLRARRLVKVRRKGQTLYYSLISTAVLKILDLLPDLSRD